MRFASYHQVISGISLLNSEDKNPVIHGLSYASLRNTF